MRSRYCEAIATSADKEQPIAEEARMYVCVCNAITDRDARAEAKVERTVAMIYRALGVKPQCGKCAPLLRQVLRQAVEVRQQQPAPG
jgi:bacterioferritin-associated ferredoxin